MNILANLEHNKILTIGNLNYIYEGENLSTYLILSVHSSVSHYDFYLEFHCPDDNIYCTEKLILDTNDRISYPMPYGVLRTKGRLKIQVVARSEDNIVFKSSVAYIDIRDSINAEQILANEFNDVIANTIKAKERSLQATDNCIQATNDVLDVINDAQAALDNASQSQNILNSAIENANSAIAGCVSATALANESKDNCEITIENANQAIANCNATTLDADNRISSMDNLYNEISTKVQNGEFDGKDAYKYAVENGFEGNIEEFGIYLAEINQYAKQKELDNIYSPAITNHFKGIRPMINYCRDNKKLISLYIKAEKTIPQLPTGYITNYPLPYDNNLMVDMYNHNEELVKRIESFLPYPLYSIEGATDSIEWDDEQKRYYVVYRTRCLDLGQLTWSYEPNSDQHDHAWYSSFGVASDADLTSPYYECASIENYYDERLINQDISGIAMLSNSVFAYIRVRIARTMCPDTSSIKDFLSQEAHKIIYKLKEEERIPLSKEISDSIIELRTLSPCCFLDAYTADNKYLMAGEYYCDSRLYADSKAQLIGDNDFTGNQIVSGNINNIGNLYTKGDYITLRHNQQDNLSLAQGAGIKIDGMQQGKKAIIRMNKEGNLYAGLEGNIKKIAYTYDGEELEGAFLFWDNNYKAFRTHNTYSKNSFLKKTITDIIPLSIHDWQQNDDKYAYTIINNNIKENSLVFLSYEDESKSVAQEIGVAKYNPIVSDARVMIIADNEPTSTIDLRLIIIGA